MDAYICCRRLTDNKLSRDSKYASCIFIVGFILLTFTLLSISNFFASYTFIKWVSIFGRFLKWKARLGITEKKKKRSTTNVKRKNLINILTQEGDPGNCNEHSKFYFWLTHFVYPYSSPKSKKKHKSKRDRSSSYSSSDDNKSISKDLLEKLEKERQRSILEKKSYIEQVSVHQFKSNQRIVS